MSSMVFKAVFDEVERLSRGRLAVVSIALDWVGRPGCEVKIDMIDRVEALMAETTVGLPRIEYQTTIPMDDELLDHVAAEDLIQNGAGAARHARKITDGFGAWFRGNCDSQGAWVGPRGRPAGDV